MSKPMYAYRIWQILGNLEGEGWARLGSATKSATEIVFDPQIARYESWGSKTLTARCRQRDHPAPQGDCGCGIYAYPDLLDALQLICNYDYCENSYYAFGLVAGYGGVHNDGSVIAHDACMRFAHADVVALASFGSGWRQGAVDKIAQQLGVYVLSLNEMQVVAETGEPAPRKKDHSLITRYLDQIPVGETVTVAPSALLADGRGRLFLRNDREVWPYGVLNANRRPVVTRTSLDTFEVATDRLNFPLLPFDGEEDLASEHGRLAGRVVTAHLYERYPSSFQMLSGERNRAVQLPQDNHWVFLDLMQIGDRLQISHACVTFDDGGSPWLRRTLFSNGASVFKPEPAAKFFVEKLNEREFALDIQVDDEIQYPYRPGSTQGSEMDTRVTRLTVNGTQIEGAKIPANWIARGSSENGLNAFGVMTLGAGLDQELKS